ncbi:MAG: glycoside hydrolase family 3 N-terminal domain-containing protein [Anaerolineae bacterium]|nr:glycoside hydrolase family 3 C-terminal domain-containing protein [Anaerolineae bacterium]MDW8098148.1 glycoside hydrolase family 3 N-terminal domain-containing protein [Anaerolineae bacterium]
MTQEGGAIYLDPTQPIERRVDDLLSRMTLDEKLAQLSGVWVYELLENMTFSEEKARKLIGNGIGQITRIAGASNLGPADSAKLANRIQTFLIENTRLRIPAIVHEECCSGYMAKGATCFPQIIGLASTWEPELAEEMTSVIRTQMRAAGAHQGLAPVLDVTRDPRWGRVEETFGEDPYLVSRMGISYVQGLQGPDLKRGIIATGKHFVGYGMSEGGLNWAPAHLSPRELREVFITPFEAAIKEARLASIMNAYHELDGIPCGSSKELLTELLRDQLGFDGIVVSDYMAINMLAEYHHIAKDKSEAASWALKAGIDIELPSTDCYGEPLRKAIQDGAITESLINEAVRRILKMKFLLGLFEHPYVDVERVSEVFETSEQRMLARRIAQKSIVLLKNEGSLLPLKKDLASIAVIGPNADSIRNMLGDYAYPAHIEIMEWMRRGAIETPAPSEMDLSDIYVPMTSVLEGIRGKISPQTRLFYAKGCEVTGESKEGFAEAIEIAKKSEVAVLVVGDKSGLTPDCTSGEFRDCADLRLPGVQEELVQAIYETGTPVVVVLITGRPYAISWMAEHVPAIVEAWLPGEEGGHAVADVLFGDYNPGGKLPITFPRAAGQVPIFYSHKPSGGRSFLYGDYVSLSAKPLFPFGHGLSYTRFEFENLQIIPDQVSVEGKVQISVDIKNVGERAGEEVVQLYTHDVLASVTRPVKELKGFKRIALEPGEKKTVTFTLSASQLGFYNREMEFVVEPGAIEVMIGSSSEDIRLTGKFEIVGETTKVGAAKAFFTIVDVH